jgi:hypothetical protein
VLKPSAPSLPPEMKQTLLLGLGACTLLFVGLLRARLRYAAERDLLALRRGGGLTGCRPTTGPTSVAAYALTALVYVGYAVLLVRRRARARRALARRGAGGS